MISVGLVGCGRIAKRHADLLASGTIKGANLKSVCDINNDRLNIFQDTYGVNGYKSIEEMMNNEKLDLAVVLTESGNHAKHVIELANYKKHVIVEKPMALRIEDAERMISACNDNHVQLFVVKQNRFNLPVVQLRKAIESNRFGKLVLGSVRVRWCRSQEYYDQDDWRGTWAMDGGVLTNQASHHIDMLIWMMGDVEEVYAIANTQLANIETEDTAIVSLKFTNGAIGCIEATTATRPKDQEGSISILGENGMVEIGGFAMNAIKVWEFINMEQHEKIEIEKYSVNPPNVYGFGHQEFYDHVIRSINEDTPNIIDGYSGKKTVEVINAIYKSIENNMPVRLTSVQHSFKLGIHS